MPEYSSVAKNKAHKQQPDKAGITSADVGQKTGVLQAMADNRSNPVFRSQTLADQSSGVSELQSQSDSANTGVVHQLKVADAGIENKSDQPIQMMRGAKQGASLLSKILQSGGQGGLGKMGRPPGGFAHMFPEAFMESGGMRRAGMGAKPGGAMPFGKGPGAFPFIPPVQIGVLSQLREPMEDAGGFAGAKASDFSEWISSYFAKMSSEDYLKFSVNEGVEEEEEENVEEAGDGPVEINNASAEAGIVNKLQAGGLAVEARRYVRGEISIDDVEKKIELALNVGGAVKTNFRDAYVEFTMENLPGVGTVTLGVSLMELRAGVSAGAEAEFDGKAKSLKDTISMSPSFKLSAGGTINASLIDSEGCNLGTITIEGDIVLKNGKLDLSASKPKFRGMAIDPEAWENKPIVKSARQMHATLQQAMESGKRGLIDFGGSVAGNLVAMNDPFSKKYMPMI